MITLKVVINIDVITGVSRFRIDPDTPDCKRLSRRLFGVTSIPEIRAEISRHLFSDAQSFGNGCPNFIKEELSLS